METFRTVLKAQTGPFSIRHSDQTMLVGSCFTEHIGERLAEAKFPTLQNPFGIVYNPISAVRCLERLFCRDQFFSEAEIFQNAGLWHSWEHHGAFSKPEKGEMLAGLHSAYSEASAFLQKATRLLLTFGTADAFALHETGQIVANNHKVPTALFDQRRLSIAEIVETTIGVLGKIKSQNVDLQVILTVSPVRHLRNGAVANQRSKATLVLACEAICRQLTFAHYFPAYEILLDDLRDYRFYASDMLHPSEIAVEYIWEHFMETYLDAETRQLVERIDKIRRAMQHRPFHPDTEEHKAFRQAQWAAVVQLKKEYPELDVQEELNYFR